MGEAYNSDDSLDFANCDHPHIDRGQCVVCGENVHNFNMEREISNEKASLSDYVNLVESIKSLPEKIKSELVTYFSNEISLPSNIRSALSLIYQLSITFNNKCRNENKDDYGFVQSEFDIEISKIHKNKFGRKNINQINKKLNSNDEHSCIIIDSPQKYVNAVCKKNSCSEWIPYMKEVFNQILHCDKDKSVFELNPELCVIAMISLFNDKYKSVSETDNGIARANGISATSLKNTKKSLTEIMKKCDIKINFFI